MAAFVSAPRVKHPDYQGLPSIFEYTNNDGSLCRTNCGQAAAVTLLTHLGKFAVVPDLVGRVMRGVERLFPPDQLGGWFGTGRRQVQRICRAHGVPLRVIEGEEALREQLAQGQPVAVMLGVCARRLWDRIDLPGGHWMVAYGFDQEHIYLTNYGWMTWPQFRRGWHALVPRLILMAGRGLVPAQTLGPAQELAEASAAAAVSEATRDGSS